MTTTSPTEAGAPPTRVEPDPTREQVLAFATAVSGDVRAQTLVLDESGSKIGDTWMAIEEAVDSGRAFMVVPRPTILALDADSDTEVEALRVISAEMASYGFVPFLVHSGRGQHLFIEMPVVWVSEWAHRSRQAGLAVRRDSPIRPPLSPHPAGLPVAPVDMAVDDALALFTAANGTSKRLSRRSWRMLRYGSGGERYRSGSEMVQAVATACVNAGLPREWFMAAMSNPANALSAVARSRRNPEEWLSYRLLSEAKTKSIAIGRAVRARLAAYPSRHQ